MVKVKKGVPGPSWDQKLASLGGHFLQSRVWAGFQAAIDREVYFGEGEGWCWMGALRTGKGIRYLLCGYGPTGKDAKALEQGLADLTEVARELNCDFVRFEPVQNVTRERLLEFGAQEIKEVQPAHTIIVDLAKSEEELRADLTSGHRNLINGTERRGIIVRKAEDGEDTEDFLRMLHETAEHSKVKFFPDWYYRKLIKVLVPQKAASFYLAEVNGQKVAGALFYDWSGRRYYAHAGAHQVLNREHKASVSLVWRAIIDAKNDGFEQFDLWGVAPPGSASHPWSGITQFKQSFGGKLVAYLGTWDRPLRQGKYKLYKAYRYLKGRG